jgi:hypothetical protein
MLESGLFSDDACDDDAVQPRRKDRISKRRRQASHVPKELRIPTCFPLFISIKNDVLSCQETMDKSGRGDHPRQGVVGEAVVVKKVKIHDTGANALIDFGQDHLSGDLGWEGRFNGGGGSWGTWEREGGKSRGKTGHR